MLCLVARQRAFELLAERTPRAEDERFDGRRRQTEDLADLGVRATLELTHDDRGALVEREVPERAADVFRRRCLVVVGHEPVGDVEVELNLFRSPRRGAEALAANVVRDRDEPVEGHAWLLAALEGA